MDKRRTELTSLVICYVFPLLISLIGFGIHGERPFYGPAAVTQCVKVTIDAVSEVFLVVGLLQIFLLIDLHSCGLGSLQLSLL